VFEFDQPIGSFVNSWGCTVLGSSTTTHKMLTNVDYNAIFAGNWGDQTYPSLKWTHAWDDKSYGSPDSRHILYGAMVGGPGSSDDYTDARDN